MKFIEGMLFSAGFILAAVVIKLLLHVGVCAQ